MDLNKAMIIGRLTRDPEVRTTPSGQTVASMGVATGFTWTDQAGQKQEKTEFHNVVAWRRLGEICGQYLKKGAKVYFEGRLQTRDWVGQDNVKRYRTEIIADNMIMLDTRSAAAKPSFQGGSAPLPEEPVINVEEETATPQASAADDSNIQEDEIKLENIPF